VPSPAVIDGYAHQQPQRARSWQAPSLRSENNKCTGLRNQRVARLFNLRHDLALIVVGMRHVVAIALLVAGCDAGQRAPRPAPVPAPEPPPPTPAPAPEPQPAFVDLVHQVPGVTVAVSSQVKNPRILPAHLIDQDLMTAWNSRTNRLAGTWIEVRAPGSRIRELRMTVGHTGKASNGEDYFTMNPRIVKVAIDSSVDSGRVVSLDPQSREVQTIQIEPAEWARITIVELMPGTKRTWREVAVSELSAWGTPPPSWHPGGAVLHPIVGVGGQYGDFCADLAGLNAERAAANDHHFAGCASFTDVEQRRQCGEDPDGRASCDDLPLEVRGLAAPWPVPTLTCELWDDNFGPTTCWVSLESARAIVLAVPPYESATPVPMPPDAYLTDVVDGGARELVIRTWIGEPRADDPVVICRAAPLSCTAPEPARTALSHAPVFR
jgi:hypothetical protein